MNDPRAPRTGPLGGLSASQRAGMADALQQALKALGTMPASGAGMTPEMLTELARRAGVADPAQMAELSRLVGLPGGGAETGERVPQHVFFMLGETECALPAVSVQGVERITEVTAVPNTAPWVLGVVQVWGSILSVVDLRRFFDLPSQPLTSRSRLLVVTQREMTIGFAVDYVTEMRPLTNSAVSQLPRQAVPEWLHAFASEAIAVEGRTVSVLDPERLLFSEKTHRYRAEFS